VAFRDAFEDLDEVIVDPLPFGILAHREPIHRILA
jgi:hypothetical protein